MSRLLNKLVDIKMNKLLQYIQSYNNYRTLAKDTRSDNFTAIFGVQKNEKPIMLSAFDSTVLYVVTDYIYAQQVVRSMNRLGYKYAYLPHIADTLLYTDKGKYAIRNTILYQLSCGQLDGVVVCAESLVQWLPQVSYVVDNAIDIKVGQEISPQTLLRELVNVGYNRVDGIEDSGQVLVRGDIVEMYVADSRYRVDFWGDTIDSIVRISPDRTSTNAVDSILVVPITANSGSDQYTMDRLSTMILHQNLASDARARLDTILSKIEMQCTAGRCYDYWLTPLLPHDTLAQYLPSDTVVVWDEPRLILDRVNFVYREHDDRLINLLQAGEVLPMHANILVDRLQTYRYYSQYAQCAMQGMTYGGTFFRADTIHTLSASALTSYYGNLAPLAKEIDRWIEDGYEVVACVDDERSCQSVMDSLAKYGVHSGSTDSNYAYQVLMLPISIDSGFVSHTNRLVLVGQKELGIQHRTKLSSNNKKTPFLSVQKGEYVVHEYHGIGLYEGIQRITTKGDTKDYMSVLYKNGDRLLVPAESSNSLTRYSGGENPKLSKLGGKDFETLKSKVKSSIKAMSIDLVRLYSDRQKPRGFVYNIDNYLVQRFADDFEYTETADQSRSINEVYEDLARDKIMDRVLVGDVGFGKTEIAMRAVFAVVSNGYQCAVLAPTTILSEQHYKLFAQRLSKFGIRVGCVNRFRSADNIKLLTKQLSQGKLDVVVGTHRLLSQDIVFDNLGLLVLDEEQRFGVEHKEKIKSIKNSVDVLTLSATPIPRTLHMALSGIRDISTITTPPVLRQSIDTHVAEYSPLLIKDVIMRELNRGGQVFVVYNRVQSIDMFANRLLEIVPDANIVVAHGQMAEQRLENAIIDFQQGKYNVLLCTTIIENGIDIPNANTILVMDADTMGLSQLYQLKGRVGRSDKLAFAYFLYREGKVLTSEGYSRLTSLTEYSQLGSGFKIAMKDLEIRGAGNILGREQHGHMVKVGYDMYAKLLQETLAEAVGDKVERAIDTVMNVDMDAYAPEDYIVSTEERMEVYQQIAGCTSVAQLEQVHIQLTDVYGVVPIPLSNLLTISQLKVLCAKALVCQLSIKGLGAELTFGSREDMFRQCVIDSVIGSSGKASFGTNGYIINIGSALFVNKLALIGFVKDILIEMADNNKILG